MATSAAARLLTSLVLEGTGSEFIAKFLNFETLSMQGSDWTLTGAGTFSTSALVGTGLLSVNGTLTSPLVTVDPLARLGGSGTIVGAVTNKGTIAAGNSIGTLSVQGSLTFDAGSTLETEVNAAGQTDLVNVTGAATINGGNVSVLAASGSYAPSTQYTIVSTTAGRTGVFSGVTSNLAFLAPSLTYDANNVYLTLVNNGIDFDAIGGTPNQRAAGTGVQGLGTGNPIYDAVLVLDIPGARYAFDQLSGEIHASTASVLIDDSRHVREAALGRLRDDHGEGSGKPGLWAQAYGAQTDLDGDGNAADLGYDSAGVFAGMDGEFGNAWQAGALIGYSRASFDVDARSSSGSADSFHLAAYGGGEWGGFGLRAGAAYAWHDIETARAIVFQGYADSAAAAYDGHTAQAFGEVELCVPGRCGDLRADRRARLCRCRNGWLHRKWRRRGIVEQRRQRRNDLLDARRQGQDAVRHRWPESAGIRVPRLATCLRRHRSDHRPRLRRRQSVRHRGRPDRRRRSAGRSRARHSGKRIIEARHRLFRPVRRRCDGPIVQGSLQPELLINNVVSRSSLARPNGLRARNRASTSPAGS